MLFKPAAARLGHRIEIFINPLQRAKLADKLLRRLIADAWNAGNVIHRVANQREIVSHQSRFKAVLFSETLLVIEVKVRHAARGADHRYIAVYRLKEILIS